MNITKPSILRLLKKSGVKSVSDSCYCVINEIVEKKLEKIIEVLLIVNSEHQVKTLTSRDLYNALSMLGINLAVSNDSCVFTAK